MRKPDRRERKTLLVLSAVVPIGLLIVLKFIGILPSPIVIAETMTLEPAEWQLERPESSIDIMENIERQYSNDVFMDTNLRVDAFLDCFEYGPTYLTAINLTAYCVKGHIVNVNVTFYDEDPSDYILLWPAGADTSWQNLSVASYKDLYTGFGGEKAFVNFEGVDNSRGVYFKIVPGWILYSPYNQTEQLKVNLEVVYFNGTAYKRLVQPFQLKLIAEDNTSFERAKEVSDGQSYEKHVLGGINTMDFYKVYLSQDETLNFTATLANGMCVRLCLYSPSDWSTPVASVQNEDNLTISITNYAATAGWWYIQLKCLGGCGYYNMSVETGEGGGCPFVYVWNGQHYIIDNNLLPTSMKNNGTDVEDYYKLEQTLVPEYRRDLFSLYSLQICEFENEHSYLDQIRLLAVDHNPDFNIALTPEGEIINYWKPLPPILCTDNNGNNRKTEISSMDGNVSDPSTFFDGQRGDYLILNFGKISAENAKLILRSDRKCKEVPYCCIEVQILNNSQWQTVSVVAPREYWATEAVNLTSYVIPNQDFVVRFYWTLPHRLDYVGLDTSPSDQMRIISAAPIRATHSTQGDVTMKLLFRDYSYAELVPNEKITLKFLVPNNLPGTTRTFIFYTNGHYYTIGT